jgi:hypothetical protein
MANSANPLAKHFRHPALYLALASKGRFYPEGTLELSATGTVPIFPMTVKDELGLKTPDALLSGEAVVNVIKSCCPAIKDPWQMPITDLDPVLIAIRLASYGKSMEFTSECPHCKETHDYDIDLNMVLDSIGKADYTKTYTFDDLMFKFKPQTYKNMNRVNLINFENDKLVQNIVLNETMTEEEKMVEFKKGFEKIRKLNVEAVADSIDCVILQDGNTTVTDRDSIMEFLENCSLQTYEGLKKVIQSIVETFVIKPLELKCDNEDCGKEFKTNIKFDQSSFFG